MIIERKGSMLRSIYKAIEGNLQKHFLNGLLLYEKALL